VSPNQRGGPLGDRPDVEPSPKASAATVSVPPAQRSGPVPRCEAVPLPHGLVAVLELRAVVS
jgi:hypothetical protein